MSYFEKNKWYISGFVVLIIVILLILLLPPFLFKFNYSETLGTQQLYFSIVAFSVIWITLLLTIRQFRKSMAKPHIKVAFNEKGDQSFTLTYKDNRVTNSLPRLWLINEGNAIAQHFQIDVIIPKSITEPESKIKTLTETISTRDNGNCIFSYTNTNDKDDILFVHKPKQPKNLDFFIAIDTNKCIEASEDVCKIKYRIYGDWAETQEGELKIKVKKQ